MQSKARQDKDLVPRTWHEASQLIRARFWVAVLMLVAVMVTFVLLISAAALQAERIDDRLTSERLAGRVRTILVDRLASVRAFVITGDSTTLQNEIAGRAALPGVIDTLRARLAPDPTAMARLANVESVARAWETEFARPMLSLSRGAALSMGVDQLAGKVLFDPVRAANAALEMHLHGQVVRAQRRDRLARGVLGGAIIIELLIVLLALIRFRRLILAKAAALEDQQEKLEEQAMELEHQQVELEASNEELAHAATDAEEARDNAERALRQLEVQAALLTSALESSPLGFTFYGPDLRIISVNRAITRMSGVPASEYVGKRTGDTHPTEADEVDRKLRQVLETREPILDVIIEAETMAHPGEKRPYSTSYFPIKTDTGEGLGVGVIVADLTEQRRLESDLRQSQKMDAVGQLAGGIAHDFNNLLTVIVGHTEMLLGQVTDPVAVDDVQQIQRAASQAAALTHKLLAFSRKQVLLPKVIDLNAVLKDLTPMLRRLIREDIEIDLRTNDDLQRVKADPTQVEQVLLNLVVNARDAMPSGGRLSISTENAQLDDDYIRMHGIEGTPGSYVVLSVSDNGVGMEEQVRKRAFEPFFTTKETGKGTGLGLATVYGIVKQSGGHIWLYSEKGLGTTFKIYIPSFEGAVTISPNQAPPVAGAREAETILLVEDDPAVLALAKRVLEGLGYRVLSAGNGTDALLTFATHQDRIQLLMTDVVMPGMGGAELVREISAIAPDLPVVYMSGYTGDDILERGLLDAESVFVQKPFTTQALAAAARKALEKVRM